jgi:hypothetical protein
VSQKPESVSQKPESFSIISEYFRSKGWLLKVAIPCSWKTPPLFSFRKSGKSLKRLLFIAVARRQTAQLCLWRLATALNRKTATTTRTKIRCLLPVERLLCFYTSIQFQLPESYPKITSLLPLSYL